ncbi:Protein of unknown function [Singulisphaera sp. GP187]|uniref:DUF1549 and DUF1553 domain-containing protein n=1 Tax=Singulisphaera sp. GP187 TaxID=1882752 RepID=UPI00092BA3AD|nr:DUF1549 and DUF1553 domain-containing protein [Singulisphaera sp. GP187]SIO62073.1 Protein of unknown function [Singulisphaera sp. GP187]
MTISIRRRPDLAGQAGSAVVLILVGLVASTALAESPPSRIRVEPSQIELSGSQARQQVAVTGEFADGTIRDLTHSADYQVEPPSLAQVTPSGVIRPGAEGTGRIRVIVDGRQIDVSLSVVHRDVVRPVSYRLDVVALLAKAGCNMGACHGNLNGKGGFRLSLRGDDPRADWLALTRDALGRRTDLVDPPKSLIVQKPTGRLSHEGGQRFPSGSTEEQVLLGWIAGGARDDLNSAPRLTRLDVYPTERIAAPKALRQQLVVTAEFSDGTRRDVTRLASYDISDPTCVAVSVDGTVEAARPVETTIAVRYLGGRGISRLAFLADRPDFTWREVAPENVVDTHAFQKLKALRINPSDPAGDPVFLRRAYLDAVGRLPTPGEARAFAADRGTDQRGRLVDRLLALPEFADFWALKWADLLRNEEKTMGEKGVWVFQRWLRDQFAADLPLDEFARRILTAKGSTYANPPASFYRTNRDPMTAAETVGQVFLGVRLQCARCHNHPFDVWTQDDYFGLAAYFGNVQRKELHNERRDMLDKHEINGDEVIYLAGQPETVQPRTGMTMEPKALGGPKPDLGKDPDALDDLAAWLTRDNPQFARNLTNRIWFHLMGRGIVEPVDDFRDSNPPSNPKLLDALTAEFVANGTRLRPLVALIMKSKTYQLSATPNPTNLDDEANFARAQVRLLPAEVLLDAIGQALGTPERFERTPVGMTAVQLPGARMGGQFLKAFGKPDRLLTCECERSEATTLAQAFQLINGDAVRRALEAQDNRIGELMQSGASEATIVTEIYLAALSREPTAIERDAMLAHVHASKNPRKAWEDACWAVLNSKEFLLRH